MRKPSVENFSLEEALTEAKKIKKTDQAEFLVIKRKFLVSRLSENKLTQAIWEENNHLSLRVIRNKRIGFSSSNQIREKEVKKLIEKAVNLAKVAPPLSDFVSLPDDENPKADFNFSDPQLLDFQPENLTRLFKPVFEQAEKEKVKVSGSFAQEVTEVEIANTLGIYKNAFFTEVYGSLIAEKKERSGFSSFLTREKNGLNLLKTYQSAVRHLNIDGPLKTLNPGEYPVILSPEATAQLIDFLSYLGFSALAYQEGRSFMNLGKKMASSLVSIWDDGQDSKGLPLPFDFEGVTRKKVSLIEKGVAQGLVYDSYTAGREKRKSTGHALPYPSSTGPLPLNLFLKPGNASLEELIASTKKGVFITRFFYINPMDPLKTIVTGLTRDGTYLIEKGKITQPLKNLRFTQSILEALKEVEAIGKEVEIKKPMVAYCAVPALKIKKFNFNGVSEIKVS